MKALIAAVLSVTIAAGASASQSGSYSGNWPVTAKLPRPFGNTACLRLYDNGAAGSPHSGPVNASGDMTGALTGTFQIVNGLLVVNLQSGSDTGEVVYISVIAHAENGIIGKGVFNNPAYLLPASLTFGEKGGC